MWYGYVGKVARINLSTKKIKIEELDRKLADEYIGSVGIAGKVLLDEVPSWAGGFDPANLLIYTTGPVTGTITQTAGRHSIVTKSPLTGCFGDSSAGGYFGVELKRAGYDMVIFSGRSERPTLVTIVDGTVNFMDASAYWGMDTRESDRAICRDLGDRRIRVSCIGPAGENLVRFASIMHDEAGRAAGRCGVGAVMGFKKLKALAVRGDEDIKVADPEALSEVMREVLENYRTSPSVQRLHEAGTMGGYEGTMAIGDSPTYNFANEQFGEFDAQRTRKLAYPGGFQRILSKTNTCYMCAMGCRRVSNKGEGKYQLPEDDVEGVEYESLSMLGSNLGIDDIFAVNLMNDLCNRFGLDTISAGGTIAFAMECYERGILSKEDTEGLDLRFGNADAAVTLLRKISAREGIGNLLAEGSRRAGLLVGGNAVKYSMHVKGMEIPAHDPRAFQGGGPHYACCPVGADHMEGISLFVEAFGQRFPELGIEGDYGTPYSTEKKALLAKTIEDWYAFLTASGWCLLCSSRYGDLNRFVRTFAAVTGRKLTIHEARLSGERIYNLKRSFNLKHGISGKEDTLPERLLREPNKKSNNAVVKLDATLPEYLALRKWGSIKTLSSE